MPGLVPGIHVLCAAHAKENVDGRDKPGHDEEWLRLRLTTRRAARPPLPLAGEGGVGVSHRSKLEESFPRPPRSASASTSPASGRGKRVALRADVPGIHVLTLAVMPVLDPAIHAFLAVT